MMKIIKHFLVKKTLKRRMVSGMTDDIFQKSHLWVKSIVLTNNLMTLETEIIILRANVLLLQTTMQRQLSC